jgi:5-methylthioadenosine/S-adenosylhomocysteine deaminase
MGTIAKSTDQHLLASLVRYVETKCLLAGVTSSQDISLRSDHLSAYYGRGPDRAPVSPGDNPYSDIEASEWAQFKRIFDRASCLLLHLSEGVDEKARAAFLALQNGQGDWAICSALAGIHCAGLQPADFAVLGQRGGSMVWSPLSNLLLYGETTNIAAAKSAEVPIALGSDWSPTEARTC